MLHHDDDIPEIKQKLADAIGRRAVVVNRIAELRPLTDPVERRCRSIRLATWAAIYERDPPEDGHWEAEDACETVSEAIAQIDAIRAPYATELVEMKDLRGEEKDLSSEIERLQQRLETIAKKSAKRRAKSPKKATSGSLI